ncbi:MAG: glycerate kinase, partial [Chloroflexi bacterium]|nr:glycerate kinase [Chloroflexota bacterium]
TAGVARMAREAGRPVVALVGSVKGAKAAQPFDTVFSLTPDLASPDDAMARAAELLSTAAESAGRWRARGRGRSRAR